MKSRRHVSINMIQFLHVFAKGDQKRHFFKPIAPKLDNQSKNRHIYHFEANTVSSYCFLLVKFQCTMAKLSLNYIYIQQLEDELEILIVK